MTSAVGLLSLMSAAGARAGAGARIRGADMGAFRMDEGEVMDTPAGAGAAAETFRLPRIFCEERGCVVRCFSLAGLVRMVMRGGERD